MYLLKTKQLMLLREVMDVCFDIQTKYKINFVALRMIFGCVSLVKHEVNTVIVRNDDCRQLVDNPPELRT